MEETRCRIKDTGIKKWIPGSFWLVLQVCGENETYMQSAEGDRFILTSIEHLKNISIRVFSRKRPDCYGFIMLFQRIGIAAIS